MRFIAAIVLSLFCSTLLAQRHNNVPPSEEFRIVGAIKKEVTIHISDLVRRPQDNLGDVVVRNHRGEPKDTIHGLKGILLKTLLDSVELKVEKPKEYSEFYICLVASDGYKNVYSWNELFNTEVGNHVYVVTEMDGKSLSEMEQRILVLSLADVNTGRRHLKALSKIEFKKVE